MTPTFSLCHATARLPNGWRPAYEAWRDNCDNWDRVEYVLAVDTADKEKWPNLDGTGIILTENTGRQCAVDAWNQSARVSTGKFLITVADDHLPCPHWDTELLKVIPDLEGQYVIEVRTGTSPADDEWMRCMLHSFITRKYYERIGSNFFNPRFTGFYADIWHTEVARHHGVVVDARHLTFRHDHWIGSATRGMDEVYGRQDGTQDLGSGVIGALRLEGYPK